jgi:hypothetical protein
MQRRVAACLAAGAFAAAAAVLGSPAGSVVSGCGPGSRDVVCRRSAKLRTTRNRRTRVIRNNAPQRLKRATWIQTSGKGTADLFLGMDGDCRIRRTKKGTKLITRYPSGVLLSQSRGETECTFSGYFPMDVIGRKTVRSSALAAIPIPLAVIKTEVRNTQFRVICNPTSSLVVGVRSGQLVVYLRGRPGVELGPSIDPSAELVVSLDTQGRIIRTRRRVPVFSPTDEAVFGTQKKQIG